MTDKKEHVKAAALDLIREEGLINLSRLGVCRRAGIPDGSFPHVMGCTFSEFVTQLKKEVVDDQSHAVHKSRVSPALRKDQILAAAVALARTDHYAALTRLKIAEKAGVSMGLVTNYFGTMQKLRRSVMRAAIAQEIPEIVAQGLANGDPHAKKAPPELRTRAATLLANL